VTGIVPGGKIFIDPFMAIGYDYATGLGDPNFASRSSSCGAKAILSCCLF